MTRKAWFDRLIQPLIRTNTKAYDQLNETSSGFLSKYGNKILPVSVTANAITATRSTLVIPTMFLYSNGYTILPATLVVANVAFDYVDGAVARWERTDPERKLALERARLTTQPVGAMQSHRHRYLQENWGAYFDAIADKAFAIPVWACCFHASASSPILQSILLTHISIEMFSSYTRTKALFDEPSPPPLKDASPGNLTKASDTLAMRVTDAQLAEKTSKAHTASLPVVQSAVVAGAAGKAKQFLSMLGTGFIMIPPLQLPGTVLLGAAVPLALLSVYQKAQKVVVYAEFAGGQVLDANQLAYLERVRSHGTSLIVGYRNDGNSNGSSELLNRDMLLALPSVDYVITEHLPSRIDNQFLINYGIDKVALPSCATLGDAEWVCPGLLEDGRVFAVPL